MMPGPYNVPVQMMHQGHQGRRQQNHGQQQPEYYHGYYQPQYPYQHAPYAQQWYPNSYQQPQVAYRPYPQYPPHAHQNGPMVVSSHPQHQPSMPPAHRPSYPSPTPPSTSSVAAVASTPVSTQSHGTPGPSTPSPATIHTPMATSTPSIIQQQNQAVPLVTRRIPFYPKLPWTSVPESEFPPRTRRRRRRLRVDAAVDLDMPERANAPSQEDTNITPKPQTEVDLVIPSIQSIPSTPSKSVAVLQSSVETDTTPVSVAKSSPSQATPKSHVKPALPIVPVTTKPVDVKQSEQPAQVANPVEVKTDVAEETTEAEVDDALKTESASSPQPSAKTAPKSWADLVRSKAAPAPPSQSTVDGEAAELQLARSKSASLAEVIRSFNVATPSKFAFLEPRGLVNTGNMCYMNSILQALVFCIPFYDFLEQVGKKAAHSFKSETPLLDAMILIMREFNVIDAADSVQKLKMRLKDNELEQYGDSFIPEYVYDVIKRLPRFSTMRRGHQQDAEEFMGFLLEGLHDECVSVLKSMPLPADSETPSSPVSEHSQASDAAWHEVGRKQKAAVTRSSGHLNTESPIAKIFGGKLRSELRVPGLKNSVTMEPYQSLQLDIGSPTVHNIMDALKGLTRPETLHGDFNSPRGPGTTATKQTFIESLPPVLILHLKRFQYDNTGGVQKIWKKIGYPLELTMPKEAFSPSRRSAIALSGIPKYRLTAVVYHHGKNASGGHYTVDIRRQDGVEWIRLDDTNIRRLRAEDVASAGAEEDPKVLAKALEEHNNEQAKKGGNIFESIGEANAGAEGHEWNQVNGSINKESPASARKWAAVANSSPTPSSTGKGTPKWESGKDSKVAYILFYRKIE